MRKLDFDAMSTACPPSAIRQHCVLRELYKLDITTVLTYLKNISKDDILSAPIVSGRMDARQPLTTEQWRMLLMTGKADPDLSSSVRAGRLRPHRQALQHVAAAAGGCVRLLAVSLLTDLDAFYTDHRLCGDWTPASMGRGAGRRSLTGRPGRSSTRDHHATFARTCS